MIIGLIPGAMKPFHAGHYFLLDKAMLECDKVFVYTSAKNRAGISGANMKQAWQELIIPRLPEKVQVVFVNTPVRAVFNALDIEEANPTSNTYRIYGGTEDASRFGKDYLSRRYPLSVEKFTNVAEEEAADYLRGVGESPMAKGEWVRKAITDKNYKAFEGFLPNLG